MNLNLKWQLRQNALSILTLPLSFTGFVLAVALYRAHKFYGMGLSMYPWLTLPKHYDFQFMINAFWEFSLKLPICLLLATVPLDSIIRRYLFKLER